MVDTGDLKSPASNGVRSSPSLSTNNKQQEDFMIINLGYACINMALQEKKICCNKGMIKRTFQAKGIKYASELALINVKAMREIIKWNNRNGISGTV